MRKLYIIPMLEEIEKSLEISKKYNACFEYNDFYFPNILDDDKMIDDIISEYKKLNRDTSQDILHGAFFDVTINSYDNKIFKVSDERIRKSIDIAQRLGCNKVVFHTNIIPNFHSKYYIDGFIEKHKEYWLNIIKEFKNIEIYIENMFDMSFNILKGLMEAINNDRIKICYDHAHRSVFDKSDDNWIIELKNDIRHIHINDNDKECDIHLPIGNGIINYQKFNDDITKANIEPSILIEVNKPEDQITSIEYLIRNKIYPFNEVKA